MDNLIIQEYIVGKYLSVFVLMPQKLNLVKIDGFV